MILFVHGEKEQKVRDYKSSVVSQVYSELELTHSQMLVLALSSF